MPMPAGDTVGQGSAGRKRNTANNNNYGAIPDLSAIAQQGLTGGGLPTLDPSMVANYYGQLQTLQSQLTNQLAGLRAERHGLRGEASAQKSDVRSAGVATAVEGINDALSRGMVGSSADVEGRVGARVDTMKGVTDVNRQLFTALAANRLEGAGDVLTAEQGAQQIAAGALSQRMDLRAQEQQNALQMQIAQMQIRASNINNAAQMAMAQKGLNMQADQLKFERHMANNPAPPPPLPGYVWDPNKGQQGGYVKKSSTAYSPYGTVTRGSGGSGPHGSGF